MSAQPAPVSSLMAVRRFFLSPFSSAVLGGLYSAVKTRGGSLSLIGASSATDRDVLTSSSLFYRTQALRRVYYSAYSPIPSADAVLPSMTPPLMREHRLYQADWLVRFYGFSAEEVHLLPTDETVANDINDGGIVVGYVGRPSDSTGYVWDLNTPTQFELAEEACRAAGFVVWPMVEFEADDAMAAAALGR